ncbi:MAG: hypothetical protein ONB48_18950 [candidate division KSB1 bacterium]|nr:hypothetical protein [candidate division KSB1 bacterium]MDZ7276321.1 hypothetical protein [candidate division KSB1 bacterium]MDZ7287726.1 hypothetical protein [candidate division KSB1 bacterium]MDZ7299934.1 hypothetical protein [candidate division KSB1 bacterium]MDZ7305737.1 hypothetical protein [candidate division KSB1 bacterium]
MAVNSNLTFSLVICFGMLPVAVAFGRQRPNRAELVHAYQMRADSLIRYYAHATPAGDFSRGGYLEIAARLHRNEDMPWVLARLDSLMQKPAGDMFWMYPFLTVTYVGRHKLPPAYQQRMREMWRTYHPYRGDTENHWAMYYTALYLITQMYPDEPGGRWFNGRSSQESFAEAREYLLEWMDLTTTIGQGEYDSPDYFGVFVVPMAQLYAWAEEAEMKQRAAMMLDWLLADFAVDNLNGLYTGAHSRTYPKPVKEQWRVGATAFAWLLWGNTPFYPSGEAAILALSGYQPPEILYNIATDRERPCIHRERKRTRHRIRFSEVKNAPVYKYSYMRKEYALGSSQGGLLQPIQQHTWDLTWAVEDPRGKHNTFFTIHPYSSPLELGMYFAEHLGPITELVVRSKTTYDSPDKLTGGSPNEQVFQHEDALITLCDIPPGTRFSHFVGFFSKDLARREEDPSGWIFAQGGEALIACHPLATYEWQKDEDGDWRLISRALKNGAVVQIAPAGDFASFEAFKRAVRALPLQATTRPRPGVRFTSLRGAQMEFTYGEIPRVNGVAVDYENWPLFDGPFLHADKGSRKLELRHGRLRRVLDFNTLTITERVVTETPDW